MTSLTVALSYNNHYEHMLIIYQEEICNPVQKDLQLRAGIWVASPETVSRQGCRLTVSGGTPYSLRIVRVWMQQLRPVPFTLSSERKTANVGVKALSEVIIARY